MKSKIYIILFLFITCGLNSVNGQENYWVFFKSKDLTHYVPQEYLSHASIQKRQANNLPVFDSKDAPVDARNISLLEEEGAKVLGTTRWLNAALVRANQREIKKIAELATVREVAGAERPKVQLSQWEAPEVNNLKPDQRRVMEGQLSSMGVEYFKKQGITGKNVRIAVFDVGFPNVDEHPAFRHMHEEGRIIATYDFVKDREEVYGSGMHGQNTLSCIGGKTGDIQLGLAPDAEFLLARTERGQFEYYGEELNWMNAMEWADKHGADIISSSLGYTYHRYFKQNMDGKTSLVAKAAKIAFEKGMLVVNSAGNEGSSDWEVIGTPADVEEVLSVGGVNPGTTLHTSFSSYGPTVDMRRKPDVAAYGYAIVAFGSSNYMKAAGTSFSAPLVTGFAACVMQMHPDWDNKRVKEEIMKSGNLYPYYDYVHGFGIPQAKYFTGDKEAKEASFEFEETKDSLYVAVEDYTMIESETVPVTRNYLYYHFENDMNFLDRYVVVRANKPFQFGFLKSEYEGKVLRVHYRGYTSEYKFLK